LQNQNLLLGNAPGSHSPASLCDNYDLFETMQVIVITLVIHRKHFIVPESTFLNFCMFV